MITKLFSEAIEGRMSLQKILRKVEEDIDLYPWYILAVWRFWGNGDSKLGIQYTDAYIVEDLWENNLYYRRGRLSHIFHNGCKGFCPLQTFYRLQKVYRKGDGVFYF